jgi:hypothetical protein
MERICATFIVIAESIEATLAGAMQPSNCNDASSAAVRTDLSSRTHSVRIRSFIHYMKYLLNQIRSFLLHANDRQTSRPNISLAPEPVHQAANRENLRNFSLSLLNQLKQTLSEAMQPGNCNDASSAAARTDLSSRTHSVQRRSFIHYMKYLLS